MKDKIVQRSIVGIFVLLYAFVSLISTIHVIDFFEMTNPRWLAICLAIAFEFGAAASLAAIVVGEKTNKTIVWGLFFILTGFQMQGNMWYAYVNAEDYMSWIELFALNEEDPIFQKRILAAVSGAVLPVVALGFIKSLVDYIRPEEDVKMSVPEGKEFDTPYPLGPTGNDGPKETFVEEEFDEDHAMDLVMNQMVEDLEEDEPERSVATITQELVETELAKDKYTKDETKVDLSNISIEDEDVSEDIKTFGEPLNKEKKEDIETFGKPLTKKDPPSLDSGLQIKKTPAQ